MTRVHTQYKEFVADVIEYMSQCAWSEKNLGSLERTVKSFKRMLMKPFD